MTTHVPGRSASKLLLDAEAIDRTLSRIAHELIERNETLEDIVLVGIHRRVGLRMLRLRRLVEEREGVFSARDEELPLLRYYANSIAHLVKPALD